MVPFSYIDCSVKISKQSLWSHMEPIKVLLLSYLIKNQNRKGTLIRIYMYLSGRLLLMHFHMAKVGLILWRWTEEYRIRNRRWWGRCLIIWKEEVMMMMWIMILTGINRKWRRCRVSEVWNHGGRGFGLWRMRERQIKKARFLIVFQKEAMIESFWRLEGMWWAEKW